MEAQPALDYLAGGPLDVADELRQPVDTIAELAALFDRDWCASIPRSTDAPASTC
jgi:hypothetical protein